VFDLKQFVKLIFRCYPPIATAGYHPAGNIGDHHHPTMPLRFPTSFSAAGSSSSTPQQASQLQQYLYSSPSRPMSFPPHLVPHDYRVSHVMSNNGQQYVAGGGESSYTCIGAPVGQGFPDHHPSTINRFQDGM